MSRRCTAPLAYHRKTGIIIVFYGETNLLTQQTDYRKTRVTFGIASAAFLATNSVSHVAEENESGLPLAAKVVKESFYVDDGLPSVETKQEAIQLHHELNDLFNRGGFKLHKWDSNSREVLNSISPEIRSTKAISNLVNSDNFVKTLGVEYSSTSDHFRFSRQFVRSRITTNQACCTVRFSKDL